MDFDETTLNSSEKTFASKRHQNFSIPSIVIYYITRTPTLPNGYKKLQKTCKYFYSKNPIIIVDKLKSWRVFRNDKEYEISIRHDSSSQYFSIENFENISYKIWIVKKCCNSQAKNISKLFQKIYQFDAKRLTIQNQNISFDKLLLFSSSPYLCKILFFDVKIMHSNQLIVSVEEIFAIFPKVTDFYYFSKDNNPGFITLNTVKMLLQNPNFQKIKCLHLFYQIPELFDFILFSEFVKEKKQTNFILFFKNDASETYKNQIQNFNSWAIDLGERDKSYFPALISFSWDDSEIIKKICKLRSDYISKQT